jgi:hypothetical protein
VIGQVLQVQLLFFSIPVVQLQLVWPLQQEEAEQEPQP